MGPEAITSSGSPSTSEIISEISRPARHARASPPPLIRLSCLRTVLSCSMFAPGGAQVAGDGQLVFQRDAFNRRGHQGRAAAGDQTQAKIVRPERCDQPQDFFRAGHARGRRFVDARRPRGVQRDPPIL